MTAGTRLDALFSFMFACYNGYTNTPDFFTTAKVYNIKIKEDGVDDVNLIPCYRKSDTEIGMYDVINDIFYSNEGTGTFLKGGDV